MTKITINGKTYILRYDMTVMEWIEDKFGNVKDAFDRLRKAKESAETITALFCAMANCANDYLGVNDYISEKNTQIINKHTSPGRVATITRAIMEAIADGNRQQAGDDDDNEVHDEYLKELEEQERAKNSKTGS